MLSVAFLTLKKSKTPRLKYTQKIDFFLNMTNTEHDYADAVPQMFKVFLPP